MKHLFSSLLFLLLSVVPTYSQLLYEISGNGVASKSYLFATNKLADIKFLDSIPNLFKVWGKTDKVITEMAIHDFEATKTIAYAALLPDSTTLLDIYSKEEYKIIKDAFFLNLKTDIDKIARMKPAYLTEMYRNYLLQKWLNYDEDHSLQNFFQTVAMQQQIPVYPLDDTAESIYIMFEREPAEWQKKELLNLIQMPDRDIQLEKKMLYFYKMGLLQEYLYQVIMPDNKSTLSYSDCKVYWQRNAVWVHRLQPYLAQGSAFICLDALYLGGEKGLISLLREAGYKVKPVNKK